MSEKLPEPVVYLKAQIPGATSRAADGLVRRAETVSREEVPLDAVAGATEVNRPDAAFVATAALLY